MPDSESSNNEIPDSATTARGSLFQDALLNSDSGIGKEKKEDFEIDPLNRASTVADEEGEYDDSNGGGLGGDGTSEKTVSQAREWWKFRLRPPEDDEDWWFASTAIPLLAATLGPMANVLSIAALVVYWRENYSEAAPGVAEDAVPYQDPSWCIALNALSLACGFLGNFFLLFNFTRAVRYIVALPMTIVLWFIASGTLMAITICIHLYAPPDPTHGLYSQGYWHAVMASVLYLLCSFMLLMILFFWLAAGGGIFSNLCDWSYADALYFSDVTILTVGFGDFFPSNDMGRGLTLPYAVGGIIILGLVVSSIAKFAQQLGHDKVVRKHLDNRRLKTISKTITPSQGAEERYALETFHTKNKSGVRPEISAPFNPMKRTIAFEPPETPDLRSVKSSKSFRSAYAKSPVSPKSTLSWASSISDRVTYPVRHAHHIAVSRGIQRTGTLRKVTSKNTKLNLLRNERDRFNAMRKIQHNNKKFKKYLGLSMALLAFLIVWCLGAWIFSLAEGNTYFQSLYFCYVSLLTVGYGDLAPRSNVGKPFFIVWSLCAIPTMTILISTMGDTIVAAYKQGTFSLADLTVLPKRGYVRHVFGKHPRVFGWLEAWIEQGKQKSRLEKGFPVGPEDEEDEGNGTPGQGMTLGELAEEHLDEHDLAHKLTASIRATANDLKHGNYRHYTYEEWVEFTRLIRFTKLNRTHKRSVTHMLDEEEADEGIIDWDWIGEDSPMMADQSEAEWVLDRLCESLERYMRQQMPELKRRRRVSDTVRYHQGRRRSGQQASDLGFVPVTVSGVDGPRRRSISVRAKINPFGSPRSPRLRPTPAPGPGARTPPIPGISPERWLPSSDGADDPSASEDADTVAVQHQRNRQPSNPGPETSTPRAPLQPKSMHPPRFILFLRPRPRTKR
ncbi:MAG: hypothetical protein LQ340_003162 [Diploschistes diacapsis]|nr:MAG: hypothetical protein LQ340_003162 [Diploschistes diacapsis]